MPDIPNTLVAVGALVTILGGFAGGAAVVRRILGRLDVIGEGVLGKSEVRDRSGAVIEPAVPSLQARVQSLEDLMTKGNQESRITSLEAWRETHTHEATEVATRLLDHITHHQAE